MRAWRHLIGRSEYIPWWDEALNLLEDVWDWARGLGGRRSSPGGGGRDDELARQAIAHLARLAREDHK